MVGTHVKIAVHHYGPNPSRSAISDTVVSKRRDMQVVGRGDLREFVFAPFSHQ
jgi:hypothetical protein